MNIEDPNETKSNEPAQKRQKLTKKIRTLKGGLIIEDLEIGNGPEAKKGKMVGVYYDGKLIRRSMYQICRGYFFLMENLIQSLHSKN